MSMFDEQKNPYLAKFERLSARKKDLEDSVRGDNAINLDAIAVREIKEEHRRVCLQYNRARRECLERGLFNEG